MGHNRAGDNRKNKLKRSKKLNKKNEEVPFSFYNLRYLEALIAKGCYDRDKIPKKWGKFYQKLS